MTSNNTTQGGWDIGIPMLCGAFICMFLTFAVLNWHTRPVTNNEEFCGRITLLEELVIRQDQNLKRSEDLSLAVLAKFGEMIRR